MPRLTKRFFKFLFKKLFVHGKLLPELLIYSNSPHRRHLVFFIQVIQHVLSYFMTLINVNVAIFTSVSLSSLLHVKPVITVHQTNLYTLCTTNTLPFHFKVMSIYLNLSSVCDSP